MLNHQKARNIARIIGESWKGVNGHDTATSSNCSIGRTY